MAGVFVFAGQIWARTVGVIVALVSAVFNLGFLAAYPLWSLIMIALDVMVILALTVHGSDVKARTDRLVPGPTAHGRTSYWRAAVSRMTLSTYRAPAGRRPHSSRVSSRDRAR